MKLFLKFFLILSFLIPSAPINSFAQNPPEDCVICGHACCCPEMCAPKIKELKKKKAQPHCGIMAEKESATKGCDQPMSICSLTSKDPISVVFLQERSAFTKPISWVTGTICPNPHAGNRLPRPKSILSVNPPTQEVLTPPPESPAA